MQRRNLGEMLVMANLIDEVQMEVALAEQRQTGKRFGSTLVDLKFIDENVLAAFLSRQIDIPCISLLNLDIPKKLLRKLTREIAVDCQAIPVRITDGGVLEVAMIDPTDTGVLEKLERESGMKVAPLIAPESSILTMLERFYPEEIGEDTLSVRQRRAEGKHNVPADPVFWDLVEELGSGDLDQRLTAIEESLERMWTLLERILRTMEQRQPETAGREYK